MVTEHDAAAIDRRLIDGCWSVIVRGATELTELAALVEWAAAVRHRNGGVPVPSAKRFVAAARSAAALASVVPLAEPVIANDAATAELLIDTKTAARLLHISERAVRKRITAGTLPAKRIGRGLFIDQKEIA